MRCKGFVSDLCVIDVKLLGRVCCTRLIRTLITSVPSASTSLIHSRAVAAAHPSEFKVSRCRTSKFVKCFLLAQARM